MVNTRCGRSCIYCRPSGESINAEPGLEIDQDSLLMVMKTCRLFGFRSVKITGGDPSLWIPLVNIVRQLKENIGIEEVHVISRHPRLFDLANPLKTAGVDLVNISIDTLNEKLHAEITDRNDLKDIIKAVKRCVECGIPVKVNTVIMKGMNDNEVLELIRYFEQLGVAEVKLLDLVKDLHNGSESYCHRLNRPHKHQLADLYTPLSKITNLLCRYAEKIKPVIQGGYGHPLLEMQFSSGIKVTIKDHTAGSWYNKNCEKCKHYPCHDALMALRLTADLRFQICLLREDNIIDLVPYISGGVKKITIALEEALEFYNASHFIAVNSKESN